MTIRPHDTEQILDTLSEAIGNLRDLGFGYAHHSTANGIANSLALLHGAVKAEAKKADEELERFKALLPVPEGARPKPIDVKPSPGHTARYLGGTVTGAHDTVLEPRARFSRADKRERIADEYERGEHDDER